VAASLDETVQQLANHYQSNDTNVIYKLLNSEEPGYSLKALSRLSANQISNSDLMKVEYVSNDAAMCRQTLEILSEVFIRKHKELMEGQNQSVIGYFTTATAEAAQRLEAAEKKLLEFHKKNNILNYEEQVINVASERQRQLQEYNALEMQYAGTLAALEEIERNLQKTGSTVPNSQEILQLRNKLSAYNTRITEYETFYRGKIETNPGAPLATLKRQAGETEEQLRQSLGTYSTRTSSTQNMPNKGLLDEWLKDAVLAEKMKGQLLVMRKQMNIFERESDKVAPMGTEIRKLEREKELAEKEYFNLLNGLTQSKLTQQNIELTSQLKVVDQPVTPSKPLSSKRILLVLVGAMGTFFMILASLIGAEIFDSSLKNSAQASKQTGLPVFGFLPTFNSLKKKQERQIKIKEDQLARKLLLKIQQKQQGPGPYLVGVLSNQSGEGKTTLIQSLVSSLNSYGLQVLALLPEDHSGYLIPDHSKSYYSPRLNLVKNSLEAELAEGSLAGYNLVLIEFPALQVANYPVSILPALDLILLTLKATHTWQRADSDLLERIKTVTTAPIEILLNGVLPKNMDDYKFLKSRAAHRKTELESVPEREGSVGQEMLQT
jgi:uncharacterized protein involved in exopolysaccharide biosynthesis